MYQELCRSLPCAHCPIDRLRRSDAPESGNGSNYSKNKLIVENKAHVCNKGLQQGCLTKTLCWCGSTAKHHRLLKRRIYPYCTRVPCLLSCATRAEDRASSAGASSTRRESYEQKLVYHRREPKNRRTDRKGRARGGRPGDPDRARSLTHPGNVRGRHRSPACVAPRRDERTGRQDGGRPGDGALRQHRCAR
jgi:hypothetical protein